MFEVQFILISEIFCSFFLPSYAPPISYPSLLEMWINGHKTSCFKFRRHKPEKKENVRYSANWTLVFKKKMSSVSLIKFKTTNLNICCQIVTSKYMNLFHLTKQIAWSILSYPIIILCIDLTTKQWDSRSVPQQQS